MKNLFTALFTLCVFASRAADVRIVSNARVDLQPIHDWMETHTGDRPMPNWKHVSVETFGQSAPWPICKIKIEGAATKIIYLKNAPLSALQFINGTNQLSLRIENLTQQIANDTKNLRSANAVDADYGSQYYANRTQFSLNLENKKEEKDELVKQLGQIKSKRAEMTESFAVFTGQVYAGKEVWDCGQKTQ